ncbi:MAG: hypothetical protein AAGH64_04695 [Planctomycetota bacterium]
MDALHRLVLGLALALAHIGGWNAIAPVTECACAAASVVCVCTDCPCEAEPDERREAPTRDEATVASPAPRVTAPGRLAIDAWSTDDPAPARTCGRDPSVAVLSEGRSPFAFWCVWRT